MTDKVLVGYMIIVQAKDGSIPRPWGCYEVNDQAAAERFVAHINIGGAEVAWLEEVWSEPRVKPEPSVEELKAALAEAESRFGPRSTWIGKRLPAAEPTEGDFDWALRQIKAGLEIRAVDGRDYVRTAYGLCTDRDDHKVTRWRLA